MIPAKAAALIAALALAACGDSPLPCYGTADCSGNTCCYTIDTLRGGPARVFCTSTPDACKPTSTVDTQFFRLCRTSDDCVAGGVSTAFTVCCSGAVMSRAAHLCVSPGTPNCPSQ